jgi:hypothetical protein
VKRQAGQVSTCARSPNRFLSTISNLYKQTQHRLVTAVYTRTTGWVTQKFLFLSVSKTLLDKQQDSTVSFKQWREAECQTFLPGVLLIKHTKFNLNISDFVAIDNVLVRPTQYMFLEQVLTLPGRADVSQSSGRTVPTTVV